MNEAWRRVADLVATSQLGLVTPAQLRAADVSRNTIENWIRTERLRWFLPNVLGVVGTPGSFERDVLGVTLWVGEGTAASGRCAARLHRFEGFRSDLVEVASIQRKDPRHVALPSGRRIVVHRVDHHLLPEITSHTVPVTSVRRTLLDLAGRKHPLVEAALDRALVRERESVGSMWLYLEQEWMRGRRGVRIMRDLLAARTAGQAPSDSDSELRARRLIAEEGLPSPVGQHPVALPFAEIHIDLAYPDIKLAIELDSYSWHLNRKAMEQDRARDNALQMLGWIVLRFTWVKLRYDPLDVRKMIRDCYDRLIASAIV